MQTNLNFQSIGNVLKKRHANSGRGGLMIVHLLFVSLIFASNHLKCKLIDSN